MASKACLFLLAILASSAVLATTAVEQIHENKAEMANNRDAAGVQDDWHGGGGGSGEHGSYDCEYGCCHHVFHGGCKQCCPPPGAAGRSEIKN